MLQTYRVEDFRGLDQSASENKLNSGYSPDAVNMDTENGDLAVGHGYSKHIAAPVPGAWAIRRLYNWNGTFVVVAAGAVYAYQAGAWETVYTYPAEVESENWDFEETRIGNTDYLLIANGETQMIKWDGENPAVLFGSGEYVFESTLSGVTYNATKGTATYAETGDEGTFTITMPAGWTYAENEKVAFTLPQDMGKVKTVKLVIAGNTHTMTFVPVWSSGDVATAVLTSTTEAVEFEDGYGIEAVTVTDTIPEQWRTRALNVGLTIDGITERVAEIGGKLVTLSKLSKRELAVGMSAKVRGELSDISVNFIETYYNRLFAAGDPQHPTRLYWSQPPGDTRSIEDWSMDDASDAVSGGHTEIGKTSGDPIVGLCALQNQLIIFKKRSVYRLLGDRPSNYRVVAVNAGVDEMVNTGRAINGDVPYWMTKGGMYYHDGQSPRLAGNARQIRTLLAGAELKTCKAASNRERLYFTIRQRQGICDDAVIIYDLKDRAYLLRNGFHVCDLCAYAGAVYMINEQRTVYVWDESETYDGTQIDAYWKTPFTDAGAMSITKELSTIHMRGEGGRVRIRYRIGQFAHEETYYMKNNTGEVLVVPLKNEGRVFGMEFHNEAGSWFKILGGVDLRYRTREDGI